MGTLNKNPIFESVEALCKSANPKVTFSKMCVDLRLSKSLGTKLNSNPEKTINAETAQKIADYFGVSVDRVLGSEKKEKSPTPDGVELDAELIMRLCNLTPDEIQKVDAFVQGILASR